MHSVSREGWQTKFNQKWLFFSIQSIVFFSAHSSDKNCMMRNATRVRNRNVFPVILNIKGFVHFKMKVTI